MRPAEADQIKYHAIGKINASATKNLAPKYSDVFGQWLCDEAAQDDKLLAITPAMCEGSGMVQFAKQFPERYFDVAIAEQHAVTLAAGMACEGLKPVVAIYSTFLQRGYDQLIHDVALQNLDVTFGIDRAGLVGEDGPTHAGAYDYAYNAYCSQYGDHGAKRRKRMSPNVAYSISIQRANCSTLSSR